MTEERSGITPRQKMVWEIYVPTISNEGKPFRLRHHRVWDSRVHKITGGLTILTPCKGFWVDKEDEKLHNERMIPVRIVCSEKDIIRIMEITKEHYKQIDVLAYKISEQALFLSDLNK